MLGALTAGVLAPLLSASALTLAIAQVVCVAIALMCWRIGRSRRIAGPRAV